MRPAPKTCLQIIASLLLALLPLEILSSANAGDWPQWLGPNRNGVSAETITPWTTPPKSLWKKPMGGGYSTPVFAAGKLFVHALVNDKEAEEVVAIDGKTGDVAWRDLYERPTYKSALGAGPRATPLYDQGKLITYGINGILSCYDAPTGKRLWQARPFDELKAELPTFAVCSSPIVVAGKIVIPIGGPGSSIAAYDIHTGKLAWKALDEPASSASPIIVRRGSRTDVLVQTTLRIVGLNPEDGTLRWEHPLVFQPSGVSPTPLVVGDSIICTTQDTGTLSLKFDPTKPDANPTRPWWQREWNSYFSTGTVGPKGEVYLVTNVTNVLPRADVRCIDPTAGKERWLKSGLGYFHVGLIALADGKLLLLDDAGKLSLAETTPAFKSLCSAKVCGGSFVNPVLADGKLYVRDAKEVHCIDLTPTTSASLPTTGGKP